MTEQTASDSARSARDIAAAFYKELGGQGSGESVVSPDLVVQEPAVFPYGGVYRGSETAQLGAKQNEVLDMGSLRVDRIAADGDDAFAFLTVQMKQGGAVHLLEHLSIEGGKVVHLHVFMCDDAEAPIAERMRG